MRKHELAAVLFVSSLVLISSILATLYGVYPFEEFGSESEWAEVVIEDVVIEDYDGRHIYQLPRR